MPRGGCTLWFTGLPCSGKTTIATAVAAELARRDVDHELLDGDALRAQFSAGLGFTKEDRSAHLKRVGYLCRLLTKHGVVAVAAFVSPYRDIRHAIRQQIEDGQPGPGRFVEIYVQCPLELCIQRDTKGLYKKALAGQIPNFTGVSDPYEEPLKPDLTLPTDLERIDVSVGKCLAYLEQHELVERR